MIESMNVYYSMLLCKSLSRFRKLVPEPLRLRMQCFIQNLPRVDNSDTRYARLVQKVSLIARVGSWEC